MYSWSPNLSQISLKNSFGNVVFQILAEILDNKNILYPVTAERFDIILLKKHSVTASVEVATQSNIFENKSDLLVDS